MLLVCMDHLSDTETTQTDDGYVESEATVQERNVFRSVFREVVKEREEMVYVYEGIARLMESYVTVSLSLTLSL